MHFPGCAASLVPALATNYAGVALRHFTTMTSSYCAVGDEPRADGYSHGPSTTPFTSGPQPLFAPGAAYAYWDSAMNLFARALTHAAGEPLDQLFRRRIAESIHMDSAGWRWGDFGEVEGVRVNGGSGNSNRHVFIHAREFARLDAPEVAITEGEHEGRPQFVIRTPSATRHLDRAAGGFLRLLDRDGRDWISFRKEPLSKFLDRAGGGYRGIPNMVFGQDNPDAGAGHPGFDRCEPMLVASNVIRTVTKSGRWAWTWTFAGDTARMRMEQGPTNSTWWFFYEGTVGGRWSPATQYWGTDRGGPSREQPDIKHQHFSQWRWAYFGDDASPRVLFIAQQQPDDLPDTLWYLGAEHSGAITATNGMTVFGLGRGPNTSAHFRGAGQEFVLGFLEETAKAAAAHQRIAGAIQTALSKRP
jgi:CubicO group peptidase (beta-lactamase class C family)